MAGGDKFDLGGVLGRSFSTFGRGLGPLLAMGFIVYSPYLLIEGLFPDLLQPGPDSWAVFGWFGLFVPLFFGPLLTAAVTLEVLERQREKNSTIVTSIREGWRRIGPVLLVNLVVTLCTVVGLVLFVLPALIPAVFFVAAIPVCVIERCGVKKSLARSWKLTKGARLQILALLVLAAIASVILYFPLSLLAVAMFGLDDPASIHLFTAILKTVGATYSAVLSGVIYSELREKHEGTTPEELLEVFS